MSEGMQKHFLYILNILNLLCQLFYTLKNLNFTKTLRKKNLKNLSPILFILTIFRADLNVGAILG